MRLAIGSRTYEFQLVPGPLRAAGGRPTASLCGHQRRRILISAAVPAEVRTELAALAVSAAWQHELIQRPPVTFVGDVS